MKPIIVKPVIVRAFSAAIVAVAIVIAIAIAVPPAPVSAQTGAQTGAGTGAGTGDAPRNDAPPAATPASFDLQQLRAQLQKSPVDRGSFVQEKHLRGLERPLTSTGSYVLAQGQGLLWLLQTPFQQDYRITAGGIARREGGSWKAVSTQGATAQQNRLLLAVLNGDDVALAEQFDLQPGGSLADWQLRLRPRSLLLKQIFDEIRISGADAVTRVELIEAQGDRSVIRFTGTTRDATLTAAERSAFTP